MKEKQRKTVDTRITKEKQKFLEILEKNPVIHVAIERSGVSKATFYRWRDMDKAFAAKVDEAMREGKGLISDIAIAQLITAIKEKNLGAIKFWLQSHHPDYTNKLHITAEVEQEIILSPDKEELLRRAQELLSGSSSPSDHGI